MINAKTVLFFEDLDCNGNKGYRYAQRAYEESVEMKTDKIIVKELPWGSNVADEMSDFCSVLIAASVEKITEIIERTFFTASNGDTHSLLADFLGYDGWSHAGRWNRNKKVYEMVVYNRGEHLK